MKTAIEIATEIRNEAEWNFDLLAELCELAEMTAEWEAADGESFEAVAFAAAEKLGVEIVTKKYRVIEEYICAWYGSEATMTEIESAQESGMTIDEIERLAAEWGMDVESLMEQVEEIR